MHLIAALFLIVLIGVTVKPFDLLRFELNVNAAPLIKTKVVDLEPEKATEIKKTEDIEPESVNEDVTQMGLGLGFDGGSSNVSGVGGGGTGGGGISVGKPAKVLRRVDPVYPEKARNAQVTGTVTLKIHVSDTGEMLHCVVVSSDPAGVFDESALQAVGKWSFEPAIIEGRKVSSYLVQKVSFKMENL